jgi:hypothetical protein
MAYCGVQIHEKDVETVYSHAHSSSSHTVRT